MMMHGGRVGTERTERTWSWVQRRMEGGGRQLPDLLGSATLITNTFARCSAGSFGRSARTHGHDGWVARTHSHDWRVGSCRGRSARTHSHDWRLGSCRGRPARTHSHDWRSRGSAALGKVHNGSSRSDGCLESSRICRKAGHVPRWEVILQ